MKIGLDLRCLPDDGSEGAGIAHAARELCGRLAGYKKHEWVAYATENARWGKCVVKRLASSNGSALRRAVRQTPCDLLFVPSGAVALNLGVKAVPWVHDLIIFEHPEWFPQNWLKRQFTTRLFLRGIRRAPLIFSVSEYTCQAIIKYAGLSKDKMVVTGEGGDSELMSMADDQLMTHKKAAQEYAFNMLKIRRPYILCLGTVEPRKNIALLIRAWYASRVAYDLVIAGRDGWGFNEVDREISNLKTQKIDGLHRLRQVSEYDKRQLLLGAKAVCVPSLDEGFGLVALEAMQAGTRVIASDIPTHKVVVGDVGQLIDPHDEQAWIKVLHDLPGDQQGKIFNSVGLGNMVRGLGGKFGRQPEEDTAPSLREQARQWTWDKVADRVMCGLEAIK